MNNLSRESINHALKTWRDNISEWAKQAKDNSSLVDMRFIDSKDNIIIHPDYETGAHPLYERYTINDIALIKVKHDGRKLKKIEEMPTSMAKWIGSFTMHLER